jgi:hypothetical protein
MNPSTVAPFQSCLSASEAFVGFIPHIRRCAPGGAGELLLRVCPPLGTGAAAPCSAGDLSNVCRRPVARRPPRGDAPERP